MFHGILHVATLLTAGLMVGNEWTVALFLHPTISRLPDEVHVSAARAFAQLFGRVMPFWYAAVFLLSLAESWTSGAASASGKLYVASSVLWFLAIVFTVIFPVPINNRIAAWDLEALPPAWRADRQRWDRLHAIRVGILLMALLCLTVGVVVSPC